MYNSDIPTRAQLPSTRQLVRSTILALVSAAAILVTVVLPADYGIDPTGVGRLLGLTDMGITKTRLAIEAAQDAAAATPTQSIQATADGALGPHRPDTVPLAPHDWRDETRFTLAPGQGTEIKLVMQAGDTATFAWRVQGGVVNVDTHGDATGRSISYEKKRAVASDSGELVAAFAGNHGWFWRNRGHSDVTLVLHTGGVYADIQRAF